MFGIEVNEAARFAIALIVVLVLIGLCAWLLRRFGGRALSSVGGRGRQPRLAVIDATTVDARRKLILVRRDDVEHLVMIGGPTDVVIEQNIVRAAATPSEVQVARKSAVEDGGTLWPLQPQAEPVLRAPDAAPRVPAYRASVADLSDAVVGQATPRAEPRLPEPPRESGLPDAAVPEPQIAAPTNDTMAAREPVHEAPPIVVSTEAARPIDSGVHDGARAKHFESLEQEMASLLGRPTGKT